MTTTSRNGTDRWIGAPLARVEGPLKVTGEARYAFERTEPDQLWAWIVTSDVGRGRITGIDVDAVRALPGVVEVITHQNASDLADTGDGELLVLQSDAVAYRGQVVSLVLAESIDQAREAAACLRIDYDVEKPDVLLSPTSDKLYAPDQVNAGFATDTDAGDLDEALAAAPCVLDETYATSGVFNSPMEPHATWASWNGDRLDVIDSAQGTTLVKQALATAFALSPEQIRVRSEHVGGGFGSKGTPKANVVLAVMASMITGRPVKLCFTRPMMFALAGYRSPTISRVRLGAGSDGRLTAIGHDAFSHTSTVHEFAEQTAESTRHMYAAANRRTTHRLAALDVPTPSYMRAPGECPGMFALESAMDELATLVGIDPIELRVRNEPEVDPHSGKPFSSRNLLGCLHRGAELFGWAGRDPRAGVRREGRWLIGSGVASATYPAVLAPCGAWLRAEPDGTFVLGVNAADIGTGARTVLRQIAADRLRVAPETILMKIGDSDLPDAPLAGGSMGTASWGWAVHKACLALREQLPAGAEVPSEGLRVEVQTGEEVGGRSDRARYAYGAQFAEARVDLDSGEIRVPRMVGVFAVGAIMNARTARSQFIGGMTMGLSMALHEHGELDREFGGYANHDFAGYHIASAADTPNIVVDWLDEQDDDLTPLGGKGIGEIGIVGAAAAIANAVWHATGVRVRDVPIQPDKLIGALPRRF